MLFSIVTPGMSYLQLHPTSLEFRHLGLHVLDLPERLAGL